MTDVQQANEQLQTLLNIKHIRRHLIKVGLVNRHGETVSKEEYERKHKRRSRRRHTSNKNVENKRKYQTYVHRPSSTHGTEHPVKNIENFRQHRRSKSPDHYSINRRSKSASVSQSRQKNKSQSPTRLSSRNQSTHAKNVFIRRAVSPKIPPNTDRCIVTLIYYGPQMIIDYERNWFEPEGDEIVVMQQHCGGENVIVYKGALKPNETFEIESRRHLDYPFALAFYVNGLIDNRLSICCESRYKHNVRIGGKRGLFGIINVQKSKPCRRCRFEQRVKKLAQSKARDKLLRTQISTPESNLTRPTSPEPPFTGTISLEEQHESPPHSPVKPNQELSTTNSSMSTSHNNKHNEDQLSEKNFNHQRRTLIISTEKNSHNEIATNTDFE